MLDVYTSTVSEILNELDVGSVLDEDKVLVMMVVDM